MSLVVWLPLNGDLENQGLSNVTVTNNGATVDNNGKIGKCYRFDGSSNYITISSFSVPENFSISIWGKWNSLNNWSRLVDFGSATSGTGYGFLISNSTTSSNMNFSYECGSGSVNVSIGTIVLNTWYHIVITFQGTNIKIYLNGALVKTVTSAASVGGHTLNYNYLGKSNWSQDALLNGKLNDFRIYDHCLSAKEVKELAKGLILHYRLAGPGQENLLKGNYYNYKTNSNTNKSGNLTLDTNIMPLSSMAGKTFTFSFYYSVEGDRANSGSGMDNRYGMHLCLNYTPSGGSAIQDYPCASYLYMTNTGRAIQTFTVPANCTVNDFSVAIQPTTKPASTNNATWYIRNAKLELGNKATPWCPNPADSLYSTLGYNNNIEYDCSGYRRNGTKSGTITWDIDSPRYTTSYKLNGTTVDTTSNTAIGAAYVVGPCQMPSTSNITIAWWDKINKYGRGGIFETTSTTSDFQNASDYNTTAFANWDTIFGIYNGTTRINIFNQIKIDSNWHHYAITYNGINVIVYRDGVEVQKSALTGNLPAFNGIKIGLGKAGGVYRQINKNTSDFRIYATALSAEDIAELYHSAVIVDNTGKSYTYEYFEAQ